MLSNGFVPNSSHPPITDARVLIKAGQGGHARPADSLLRYQGDTHIRMLATNPEGALDPQAEGEWWHLFRALKGIAGPALKDRAAL